MRFAAARFAPQLVLSGLSGLQFALLPLAARWMLGASVHASSVVGVGVVLLGEGASEGRRAVALDG